MAHFVRPLVLAESLPSERYDVHFYAPPQYSRYLNDKPFATGELDTMPGEQFLHNIAHGAPLFPASVLRGYIEQEQALFKQIRPALVIGDMRLSLPISARLASIPHAILMNAYWSPYTRLRTVLPALPITRFLPPSLILSIFRRIEPRVYAFHVAAVNEIRREYGMPPLPPDIRAMYTDGEYVLYPDVPEFVSCTNLPNHHRYMGVCDWSTPLEKPAWWDEMRADPKPKVFVGMGSSGRLDVLPRLLRVLRQMPVSVLLATSGRQIPTELRGVYVANLLPFAEAAAESSLVVCNGGSGSVYPALAAGAPVLGIAANADQQLTTAVLEENGAGLGLRIEHSSERNIRAAVEKLLYRSEYRERARKWAEIFRRYDAGARFREFADKVTGG